MCLTDRVGGKAEITLGGPSMNPHPRTTSHAAGQTGIRAKVVIADRTSGIHLTERARAARVSPSPQAVLSEVTRHLSSTLDYTAALEELTRVIAEQLGCGCVIDVFEPGGQGSLEPLVAEVVAHEHTVTSAKNAGRSRASVAVERVRRKLGATWLISAPLVVPPRMALGTLSIFGTSEDSEQVSAELVRDIARHTAIAIENGRLYRGALVAAREREHILALVAHELKNPLGVILMSAARARLGGPRGGRCSCADHELDVIHRAALRMKKLVGDLLDLSSIDAGKLSVRPSACRVDALVRNAARDVTPSAVASGIAIIEDLAEDLPLAWVDGDRIAQVLVNLLTNAIKFTPRGGRVRVRATHVDHELVIAVEDCGRGIAPSDLAHVFDRFWQAADTAKLGTGLGLGICKSIIELSGGRIWAQSTVGVGTTFYFSIPAAA